MSTELSNGVIIPEEYSDDWYDEMSINLRKLNDVITAASDNATDIQRLDTDKANQSDLTALTSRVSQNETDITALQTAVSGALKREIVQTLPTEDISTTTIYMIRNSESSGTNIYDEYMYINSQWELIGTSATDFSNYYTKNETDNLLSGKVDNSTLGSYYTKTESDTLLAAKANSADLATVATSGSYNDLSNKPTINDSTITIQKNGSTVDTFTTNGSAKTINIPVPTKTSDLTNDSNFVDTSNSAVASGITSAKVTSYDSHIADTDIHVTTADKNKWNNQTYVFRYSSTALTASSTNSNTLLDNTDNLKVGDKVIDSSGVLFSITAIDTANSTFTIGTALIDLAVDANVMHLSGNETASGEKIFSNMSSFQGSYLGSESSANARTVQILESNRDTHGQSGIYFTKFRQNKPQGGLTSNDVVYLSLDLLENSVRTNNAIRFNFRDFVNDVPTSVAFYPTGNNNSLGGSTWAVNKWTKINGVEPGALSLPDLSNGVDISGYFTLGTSSNNYTPIADGWICIKGVASGGAGIYVESSNGFYCSGNNLTDINSAARFVNLSFPVIKNEQYTIVLKTVNTSISAKFFPCQGNI